jgi:2-dehydro-3-deoxyphosphogluconate aldolase / (4S)-4-hydroxy-2-oxoglutarate aldolase
MEFKIAFDKNPLIGVLRGIERKDCTDAIEAAVNGGITCVEITMNTAGASSLIDLSTAYFKNKCCIGAGTVLTIEQCTEALDAGAQYIVAPNTKREVIAFCKKNNIPVIPGALTPSEVFEAWYSGATFVKVFPVGSIGGPDYIKELRGPFPQIPLVAFGGVTIDKVDDYFRAGVNGIGLGGKIFNQEWIKEENFKKIEETVESFTKVVEKNRNPKKMALEQV